MRPSWSLMLAVVAAAAVLQAYGAAAAGPGEAVPGVTDTEDVGVFPGFFAAVIDAGDQAWLQVRHWVGESYARAPALMLGLTVLLAVPPLALAGMLMRRKTRPAPDATVRITRLNRRSARTPPPLTTVRAGVSTWPTQAWVEVMGIAGERHVIGRTMVRIGREEDNDICLSAHTVHRYHAVIRRTTDGDVVITDLSGDEGNGVLVNGVRVTEARLTKGDMINVGEVKLRFDAHPA
jgi:hypothetical protein